MTSQTLPKTIVKTRPALRLVGTKKLPREDWLAVRKGGIGSSDAAAAVGLNPYKSQLELWLEKTGRDASLPKIDPQDEESPAYWGNVLEPSGLSLEDALLEAKQREETRQATGFDQSALDLAARQGFKNGVFEDSEEDTGAIVEEFFTAIEHQPSLVAHQVQLTTPAKPSLAQKLDSQATRHNIKPSVQ